MDSIGKMEVGTRTPKIEAVRDDYCRAKLCFTELGISDCSFRQGPKPTRNHVLRGNVSNHSFEGKILVSVFLAAGVVRNEELIVKIYDLTRRILGDDCILESVTEAK